MTSPIVPQEDTKTKHNRRLKTICKDKKCFRHALNIKTKCCRSKCKRLLKKKLHGYTLRPNGEEDPEIIDVSNILLSKLKIKSPTKQLKISEEIDFEELRPRNYLFKMARGKHKVKSESKSVENNSKNAKSPSVSHYNGKITMYTTSKSSLKDGQVSEDLQEAAAPIIKMNGSMSHDSQKSADPKPTKHGKLSLNVQDPIGPTNKLCENLNEISMTESQEKIQTNAFKLLMESRNKSIGGNSPGKEKHIDILDAEQIVEKRTVKAKRNLALQKMAEAKGALKYKETEEQQDQCIQRKMAKRAERLKNMLANTKPNKSNKESKVIDQNHKSGKEALKAVNIMEENQDQNPGRVKKSDVTKILPDNKSKKEKSLHLVDIFKEVVPPNPYISPEKKVIRKVDEEFLKKLSPSIRKKENMLCYFKKVEKKIDSPIEPEDTARLSPVIKIKVASKTKKKMKKRKLSLNKDATNEALRDLKENSSNNNDAETVQALEEPKDIDISGKIRKEIKRRKRKENSEGAATPDPTFEMSDSAKIEEGRPKRSVKRPIKYVDDIQLSSSDEELHIFTPRKRRHVENKNESFCKNHSEEVLISDDEIEKKPSRSKKASVKDDKSQKKPVKLAPIFAPKPLLDLEQLEAKQKFLYSGVPNEIKKMITQQKQVSLEIRNEFPVVRHIQQISEVAPHCPKLCLPTLVEDSVHEDMPIIIDKYLFKKLFEPTQKHHPLNDVPTQKQSATVILHNIKKSYPKFPVFRTYRTLKSQSRGEFQEINTTDLDNSGELMNSLIDNVDENPEYLNWTDKYKPMSTKHLIGNFEGIKEIRKWLTTWTDNDAKTKVTANDSDSSDFLYDSDSNSRGCVKNMNNLLILNGPPGSGKTSSVYAVASELAIKVIEVNASSKRTGKMMLQDLQEATQSHKVNRAGLENSQKIPEIIVVPVLKTYKKRGRPKKSDVDLKKSNSKEKSSTSLQLSQSTSSISQESVRAKMSLILVDDADIVFDQDDGFSSAIGQLIQCSKRPVILVTGSLSCPHLQRFMQCGKVINMNPLLPRMLGTWLDLMCLAENGTCWPGLGTKFLEYFKGDIRKTINCLQFYTTTRFKENIQDKTTPENCDYKSSPEDENSNLSWPDNDGIGENNSIQNSVRNDIWNYFMDKLKLQHIEYPTNLFNIWWSLPTMFEDAFENQPLVTMKCTDKEKHQNTIKQLATLLNLIDIISVSDLISNNKPDTSYNITSEPWYSTESNSVSELESLEDYNKSHEVTSNIIQNLVSGSLDLAQRTLQCEGQTDLQFPTMTELRAKNRILRRHESLTEMMNPSATLDRRALALDYWSSCRSICRIEKNRTDTGLKRNKRFCHYLKSMNASTSNETFESLGDSLYTKTEL